MKPSAGDHPPAPGRVKTGERGYNLVILTVMITVMNIALAAALPRWTAQIQREREEELIFRGLQYAEAIRIFQIRFGRLPVRLEELLEVEPRSIRQLWTNPMREDGRWALIFQTGPGRQSPANLRRINDQRQRRDRGNGRGRQSGSGSGDPNQPDAGVVLSGSGDDGLAEVATGPIRGVYHPGDEMSFKTFIDTDTVSEWKFTLDLLQTAQGQPPGGTPPPPGGNSGGLPQQLPLNASQIGRPFPPGIQPPGLQDGSTGGSRGGVGGSGTGPGGLAAEGLNASGQGGGGQS